MAREHLRRARIGDPAAVAGAVAPQHGQRLGRIADAVDVEREARFARRREQEVLDLAGALAVAPVADPDEALALALDLRRMEQPNVRRLVPDDDAVAPAPAAVDLGQGFACLLYTSPSPRDS